MKGLLLSIIRRRVAAIITLVAAFGIALLAWFAAWSNIDVKIEGSYSVHALDDEQARQAWTSLHAGSSDPTPPGKKLLVKVYWNDKQRVHWPATECEFIIFLTHPQSTSVIAYQGEEISLGSSGLADKAIRDYADIPAQNFEEKGRSFEGSTFFVPAARSRTAGWSVLLSGESVDTDRAKVGILYACNGRLIKFTWLPNASAAGVGG